MMRHQGQTRRIVSTLSAGIDLTALQCRVIYVFVVRIGPNDNKIVRSH